MLTVIISFKEGIDTLELKYKSSKSNLMLYSLIVLQLCV